AKNRGAKGLAKDGLNKGLDTMDDVGLSEGFEEEIKDKTTNPAKDIAGAMLSGYDEGELNATTQKEIDSLGELGDTSFSNSTSEAEGEKKQREERNTEEEVLEGTETTANEGRPHSRNEFKQIQEAFDSISGSQNTSDSVIEEAKSLVANSGLDENTVQQIQQELDSLTPTDVESAEQQV